MFRLDERLQADTVYLCRLPLCKVLMMKDRRYPWVILVPSRSNVFEYYHLKKEDRLQLMEESAFVAEKMADHFASDSMNIAALGNVVAQLHVHHVARFKTDPAWPGPVWGHSPAEAFSDEELKERSEEMINLLNSHFINESEADDDIQDTVYW